MSLKEYDLAINILQWQANGYDEDQIIERLIKNGYQDYATAEFVQQSYKLVVPLARNAVQAALSCFASKLIEYTPSQEDGEDFNFLSLSGLNRLDRDIVYLRAKGYTNKKIASKLEKAYDTIRTRIRHIYLKLGIATWDPNEKENYLWRVGRWGTPDRPPYYMHTPMQEAYEKYFKYSRSPACSFGELLRDYRDECVPSLSQTEFAKELESNCGIILSTKSIGRYETNNGTIHKDDRTTLVAMINVLHAHGGIQCLSNANHLLNSGNYRRLDKTEVLAINPNWVNYSPGQFRH